MKEKIKKEPLTVDKIKLDLSDRLRYLPVIVDILLILMMIGLFAATVYKTFTDEMTKLKFYLCIGLIAVIGVLFAVCIVYLICLRCTVAKQRSMAKKGEFVIVQERLTVAGNAARFKGRVREKFDFFDWHKREVLFRFSGYGDYYLPNMKQYKWSERYAMSVEGMLNTSIIGDTFYLVIFKNDKKKTPVMIYNTKFFEYKEDDPWAWEDE